MAYIKNSIQRFTPTTGSTVQIADADGDIYVALNPAGTLATLTIAMPTNPKDGQSITIGSTQILTVITMTSAATIKGALTTLASVNGFGSWFYDATNSMYLKQG